MKPAIPIMRLTKTQARPVIFLSFVSLFLILVGLAIQGCGSENFEEFQEDFGPGLRIVGTVKDANGNPIAGAKVLLLGSGKGSVTTDQDGEFRIDDVAAGSYNIEVTKDGYKDVLDTIEVKTDDQPTTKAIVMEMK